MLSYGILLTYFFRDLSNNLLNGQLPDNMGNTANRQM